MPAKLYLTERQRLAKERAYLDRRKVPDRYGIQPEFAAWIRTPAPNLTLAQNSKPIPHDGLASQ